MINNTFRNDFFFIFRGVIFTPLPSYSVFPLSALPPSAVFRCFFPLLCPAHQRRIWLMAKKEPPVINV